MVEFGDPRLPERFWEKVIPTSTGCWQWMAYQNNYGYGQFWWDGKIALAHRIAYQALVGDIPEGEQCDHLCRNRGCVNPTHLEAVTSAVNTSRGLSGFDGPTNGLCRRGHDTRLTGGIYIHPDGRRECAVCKQRRNRTARANWTDQHRADNDDVPCTERPQDTTDWKAKAEELLRMVHQYANAGTEATLALSLAEDEIIALRKRVEELVG